MIKSILVAVDGSEPSKRAVDLAAELAAKGGASLTLLNVQPHRARGTVPEEFAVYARIEHIELSQAELRRQAAEEILGQAETRARANGASHVATLMEVGDPATVIAGVARAGEFDLVALGRRGLGDVSGLLLGSVSHEVAHLAPCAVLTTP
ncbi:MAG: universal stress protein [Geminicoccaceae bacterium]